MPVLRRVGHQVDGRHGDRHQHRHDDAAAVAIGPDAERHADERAGEHWHGRKQTELGGIQVQRFPDRNADHAEHHPDHEADREGEGAHDQHRERLPLAGRGRDGRCPRQVDGDGDGHGSLPFRWRSVQGQRLASLAKDQAAYAKPFGVNWRTTRSRTLRISSPNGSAPTDRRGLKGPRFERDQTFLFQGPELLQLGGEVVTHHDRVGALDRLELDPALAHQRHDDRASHQIVAAEGEPPHDWPSAPAVGRRVRGVARACHIGAAQQCLGQCRGWMGRGSGWHDARDCALTALPPA